MNDPRSGLARSVQVRLARHAKAIGVDPNLVLTRYAVEQHTRFELVCQREHVSENSRNGKYLPLEPKKA